MRRGRKYLRSSGDVGLSAVSIRRFRSIESSVRFFNVAIYPVSQSALMERPDPIAPAKDFELSTRRTSSILHGKGLGARHGVLVLSENYLLNHKRNPRR